MSFNENDPMEYFMNAEHNFKTLLRVVPGLKENMIYQMALEQLQNGMKVYEKQSSAPQEEADRIREALQKGE